MIVGFLYCLLINVFYSIHYTKLRKMAMTPHVLITILLSFMVIYSHSMEDTLQYTFPLLICNMLILECMYRISSLQIKISFLPQIIVQYFIQLIPAMIGLILVGFCVYFQNYFMPYLVFIFYFYQICRHKHTAFCLFLVILQCERKIFRRCFARLAG